MATTHGTSEDIGTQVALLDDRDFLRTLMERTLQQVLDAEMTAHLPRGRPALSSTNAPRREPGIATATSPGRSTLGSAH